MMPSRVISFARRYNSLCGMPMNMPSSPNGSTSSSCSTRCNGLPVNRLDEAADQPAIRQRVIAVLRAGFVHGPRLRRSTAFMCSQSRISFACVIISSMRYKPASMTQRLPDRDLLFAVRGERGPVLRDRVVVRRETLIDENVHQRRHHAFGRRERRCGRIGEPRIAFAIARAAPDVDDLARVVIDAHGRAAMRFPGNLPDQQRRDIGIVRMNRSIEHR